ncbi:diguanylate cyclase with PAS/PAC sensor [Leptothrix cholodnii SP-6]|uniref:Diguanylate cyclase with PAS/PAC sensor n=1 Tax=Leptothrix cholodnii (strain ATCC 51168 / LMG 8142 / SP-6) TaxID=395495 RepID=B1XYX9_LEPCP|nr:diguanylate cyclase [Leptothrix cholodnii]ACB33998.1 diguanylate cyclase with PAS/PAC sensor [Leptothrix cholodnii SP-6]
MGKPAPQRTGALHPPLPVWLPYFLSALLVTVLVVVLAGLSLWQEKLRQRERAAVAAQNVVRLLEAHVADVFRHCDTWLHVVSRLIAEREPGVSLNSPVLQRNLEIEQTAVGELRRVRVTDAGGQVVVGDTWADPAARDLSSRADFRRAMTVADAGLIVTGPKRDTASGEWSMSLMRAVRGADGRFQGVVVADLPVRHFAARFAAPELGQRGAATIRTSGLALVLREPWPGDDSRLIGSTEVSRQLREVLANPAREGSYIAATALDGIERVNAYRKLRDYPLTVIVGLATDDFAPAWNTIALMIGLLSAMSVGTVILAAVLLYRGSRRQIDAAQQRFDSVVRYSRDAIVCKSRAGIVTSWNAGAEAIFGYTEAEMLGRPVTVLLPPERQHEEAEILACVARGERVEPFETVRLHKNGQRLAISISVAPLVDAEQQIVGASSIARDVTRQRAMEEEIRSLAFDDPLTRLPNRRLLLDRLGHALAAARRSHVCAAVIFIDLDHFKQLNDLHGHAAGDRLLVDVARRLRATVRESDTVARLGGDEFVVVCTDLGADVAQAHVEAQALEAKIEAAISHDMPVGEAVFVCRASVGYRLFCGGDDTIETLLRDADAAMYATKATHRASEWGGDDLAGTPQSLAR